MPKFETTQQDATYAVPHDPEAQARQDGICNPKFEPVCRLICAKGQP